jgi:hypothetical protein
MSWPRLLHRGQRSYPGGKIAAYIRGAAGADQRHIDQAVARGGDVGIAAQLIAREVDRDVFLVDQNAADIDHRREIQEVDQQELFADAQAAEYADEGVAHRVSCPV